MNFSHLRRLEVKEANHIVTSQFHGKENIGEGRTLLWSGETQRRGGVGLFLNSFTQKALLSFTPISSRLLRARIDGNHGKITVFTCYAPTNKAKDDDLSSELSSVSPHDYLKVIGDFNAGVANNSGLYNAAVGPVTADALNDNGERLVDYCIT
ncbi:hypothetical protein QYM36_004420 [Artemia franciscana]|uniref:Endonuclease/exonuclease/phosphatase domain-containing protein n=1 Tax=Artemia franciscana TaxID=6661 RepID=A0AA88HYM5_ARTSF|nr:hypothetical protein QYM36_004420 [Artemia franciscana]